VQRHQQVAAGLQPEARGHAALPDPVGQRHEGVDHRVAHERKARLLHSLRAQVLHSLVAVQEAERRDQVGADPVRLLRHRPVEAPQAGLQVGDGDSKLRRAERRAERGVDVPRHDHQVGALRPQHRLESLQHPRDLLAMASRSDPQQVVGLGHPELLEEDLGHQPVVVLAGVDDRRWPLWKALAQRSDHRRHLHQVGPRSEYVKQAHGGREA
jgi:hypothetical protein